MYKLVKGKGVSDSSRVAQGYSGLSWGLVSEMNEWILTMSEPLFTRKDDLVSHKMLAQSCETIDATQQKRNHTNPAKKHRRNKEKVN